MQATFLILRVHTGFTRRVLIFQGYNSFICLEHVIKDLIRDVSLKVLSKNYSYLEKGSR